MWCAGLDSSQVRAVSLALSSQDIALVHGPPGTGKQFTLLAHTIHQGYSLEHVRYICVILCAVYKPCMFTHAVAVMPLMPHLVATCMDINVAHFAHFCLHGCCEVWHYLCLVSAATQQQSMMDELLTSYHATMEHA